MKSIIYLFVAALFLSSVTALELVANHTPPIAAGVYYGGASGDDGGFDEFWASCYNASLNGVNSNKILFGINFTKAAESSSPLPNVTFRIHQYNSTTGKPSILPYVDALGRSCAVSVDFDDLCSGSACWSGLKTFSVSCEYNFSLHPDVCVSFRMNSAPAGNYKGYIRGINSAVSNQIGGRFRNDITPWGSPWDAWDVKNAGIAAVEIYALETPPALSFFNLTSDGGCTVWNTNKSSYCNTTDSTPTITFATDLNAVCAVGVNDWNYTTMGVSRNCSGGEGTQSHTCTLISSDQLVYEQSSVYLSCKSFLGKESVNSSSGSLAVWYVTDSANESSGRIAIEAGINSSAITGVPILSDQQVYIVRLNGTQQLGTFDKFVVSGNQRWLFNYFVSGSPLEWWSIGNTLNLWENVSLSPLLIKPSVSLFINNTKT